MSLLSSLINWIDHIFQKESDRLSEAQEMLLKAGLNEGHVRKMMDVLVPLSSIYGFDVKEFCSVVAQGRMKGNYVEMVDLRRMLDMNFPAVRVMTDVYFLEDFTVWNFVAEGDVSWMYFCGAVVLYYDNLQKNP